VAFVHFHAYANSSHGGIFQIRAMRAKLMHLVESAAPFGCTVQ